MGIIKRNKKKETKTELAKENKVSGNIKKSDYDIKLGSGNISPKTKGANILFFYRFL